MDNKETSDIAWPRSQTIGCIVIKIKKVRGNEPWDLEFMGESFDAPICDSEFLARVENREIFFGNGDMLLVDAMLTMTKVGTRTWRIVKVWKHIPPRIVPDSF